MFLPASRPTPQAARDGGPIGFIARELAALAGRVAALEALTEAALTSRNQTTGIGETGRMNSLIVAFQDLDLIRQSLEDLARLGEAVSAAPERAVLAPDAALAESLVLGDLRDRLIGRAGRAADEADDPPEAGALSLFPPAERPDLSTR